MSDRIGIFGAGGLARETFDSCITNGCRRENIVFIVSDEYDIASLRGCPIIRQSNFDPSYCKVAIAIGNSLIREIIVDTLPDTTEYTRIVHPSAIISPNAAIGNGSIIGAGAIISCDVKVGMHSLVNLHVTLGHDCVVGDFFTGLPKASVSGGCRLGRCVTLGSNSSIFEKIEICDTANIGMGSVIVENVSLPGTYFGIPAAKVW